MKPLRYLFYSLTLILFLVGLFSFGDWILNILQQYTYTPDIESKYVGFYTYENCKHYDEIIFKVNGFDYDDKYLDAYIEIRLSDNSKLVNPRFREIYEEGLNRRPFFMRILYRNQEYYRSQFTRKDRTTFYFDEKIPLKYPTYDFPFDRYIGEIRIYDYGIGRLWWNQEKFSFDSQECFNYTYIKGIKDPDIMVHFVPGNEYDIARFFINIERKNDPYKPRILLIGFSIVLIFVISFYLLFIKNQTPPGVISMFLSLFILQSFKPHQIKSITKYDDLFLISFIIGLIMIIASFFKEGIKNDIDEFTAYLYASLRKIRMATTEVIEVLKKKANK